MKRYLEDEKMVKHCIAVETIMRALAKRLGEDIELRGLIGLLHDIDYDYVSRNMSKHGLKAVNILANLLLEDFLEAIAGHNEYNNYVIKNERAKIIAHALRVSDHVADLIVVTALVMPHRRLEEVKPETLLRKLKSKDFAKGVDRSRILEIEELGLKLEEFLQLGLNSMKSITSGLGF